MHAFAELGEVQETLAAADRARARRAPRAPPGQKEERYAQLLQDASGAARARAADALRELAGTACDGDGAAGEASRARTATAMARRDAARRCELRERVERLEREVAELRAAMRHACEPEQQP